MAEAPAPSGAKTVLTRLSGFTILPLIGLVVPLLLLPFMKDVVGAVGWSSAISGMAIGSFAAALIQWGWNVDGPVAIARSTSDEERSAIYGRSLRSRLLLAVVVVPLAMAIAALVSASGFSAAGAATALATATAGLSPAFFGIGAGRPTLLALYDTLPRALGVVVALPFVVLLKSLWPYPAVTVISVVTALVLFHRRVTPGQRWFPLPLGPVIDDLKAQRHTAGYNLAGAAYAATPVPIASATIPGAPSAPLATTDQLYRYGLFGVIALGNALQAWTLEPGIPNRRRRHLAALWAHLALGLVGIAVIVMLGPPVGAILSGGAAVPTRDLCFVYGLAFACLSVATPLSRNLLIPAGEQALVLKTTVIAAVVGVAAMLFAGFVDDVRGIALGMALSELAMLVLLFPPAMRVLNDEIPRQETSPAGAPLPGTSGAPEASDV